MDGVQTKEKEIKTLKWIFEYFVFYLLIIKVFFQTEQLRSRNTEYVV